MQAVANKPGERRRRIVRLSGLAVAAAGAVVLNFGLFIGTSAAQQPPEHVVAPSALLRPSRPLSWLQAPLPPNLEMLVQDKATATQLGKAFFWDMQVGSDGTQACATCHFAAGADNRTTNTLSPGQPQLASSFQVSGPETTLTADDFPLRKLADPDDHNSAVLRDRHDVIGSQGVVAHRFDSNGGDDALDQCTELADPLFNVRGTSVRQVTPRQAPSVINAIFYTRNFWDGRADTYFNGVNPQGVGDQTAKVWKVVDGQPQLVQTIFPSAGVASQATGPGLSEVEMSCSGRTWQDVARKLLRLRPLAKQVVDPSDSVLGSLARSQSDSASPGLTVSYSELIQKAFRPEFWSFADAVPIGGQSYSQIEANFALFWGMSIELYESTLISDQTPYDRFLEGTDDALTPEQYQGLTLFNGKAGCMNCHFGTQLSNNVGAQTGQHFGFTGFEVTGVRPVQEDHGVGPIARDPLLDGAFKTPQLRNVELTGPYFHNGGMATLRQVVDFYNRGGDFDSPNLDSVMRRQSGLSREQRLSEDQKHALVAFLLALTDERVRYDRAPFDHPSLCVPLSQTVGDDGHALDTMQCLDAVGASGATQPHGAFLGLDPYQP
jgi:cytochrome c peroxidase